jgi:nicotinate-nucleotide adenylyltransferase
MERRVGVFGGTFDPPHVGHVAAAAEVRFVLSLDVVLFVVANDPWQKSGNRIVSPAADRLAMVEAAVEGIEGLRASSIELRRGGPSYTVDTLRELRAAGADELFLVMGLDAAAAIESWHEPDEVRALAIPVVVSRPDVATPLPAGWLWQHVEVPSLDISSTDLRERLRSGRPVDGLVPPAVRAVIEARHLYRSARD